MQMGRKLIFEAMNIKIKLKMNVEIDVLIRWEGVESIG